MTNGECEIVANAGVQLREIAERLTLPATTAIHAVDVVELVKHMDAAALSISEVYGQLSALPLEAEPAYSVPLTCSICGRPYGDGFAPTTSGGWVCAPCNERWAA